MLTGALSVVPIHCNEDPLLEPRLHRLGEARGELLDLALLLLAERAEHEVREVADAAPLVGGLDADAEARIQRAAAERAA